jgi:hypothetical protein
MADERVSVVADEVAHLVEDRDIAERLAGAILNALDAQEKSAVVTLGKVCDWLGVPDWTGPQLPVDLGREIAAVFDA